MRYRAVSAWLSQAAKTFQLVPRVARSVNRDLNQSVLGNLAGGQSGASRPAVPAPPASGPFRGDAEAGHVASSAQPCLHNPQPAQRPVDHGGDHRSFDAIPLLIAAHELVTDGIAQLPRVIVAVWTQQIRAHALDRLLQGSQREPGVQRGMGQQRQHDAPGPQCIVIAPIAYQRQISQCQLIPLLLPAPSLQQRAVAFALVRS